jgi:hypothetical protein
MPQSFSLSSELCTAIGDPSLRQEIDRHTQSSHATERILSSIGRFGVDPSILRFEMSPGSHPRVARLGGAVAWTVRAVRPGSATSEATEAALSDDDQH